MPDFALLIPVYNPPLGWEIQFAKRYLSFRDELQKDFSVWLINDGSSTPMQDGVNYLKNTLGSAFNYLEYVPNKGKGAALKYAVNQASAKYYMFTDIDFPYTTASMIHIYKTLSLKGGIVTGFREEAYYADLSPFRTVLSKSLRILNSFLLGLPVNDTQCGLKAFDAEVRLLLLACKTDRFLIDLELLLSVGSKKLSITPVKVALRDDTDFTKFNSSVLLKEVLSFLRIIWKYRIRQAFS
jgi:glycosyltransferase involved in cell wall biosynthesis